MAQSEYEIQAEEFISKTMTRIDVQFSGFRSMPWDQDGTKRNCYTITITRPGVKTQLVFEFGTSLVDTEKGSKPSTYDVLSCLDYWPDIRNVDDYLDYFGGDITCEADYLRIAQTVVEIRKQSDWLERAYSVEELEQLQEIQ